MNKPLKDWTLGEIQKAALATKESHCDGCPVAGRFCDRMLAECAMDWGLKDHPRWTEREREDAKALLRVFGGKYDSVFVGQGGHRYLRVTRTGESIHLCNDLFPSAKIGETVNLAEIAGCEE